MNKNLTDLSKFLSYVLRHKPESIGLTLDSEGWADIEELMAKQQANGPVAMLLDDIMTVVADNDKKRFEVKDGKIRAVQGHSSKQVDREFKAVVPPVKLFHGTATKFVDSILKQGLQPQSRHHVHLSADIETAVKVGQRHGKVVVFEVDSKRMYADGIKFFQAENGVWLTDVVPAKYLSQ